MLLTVLCSCACPTENLSERVLNKRNTRTVLTVHPDREPDASRSAADNRLFQIAGDSMAPRFHSGQLMLISEAPERLNHLERGDVVVFRRPQAEKQFFVKRMIGMPGDTVEVLDGNVFVFNDRYPEGAVLDETAYVRECEYTSGRHRWQIGAQEYVVLGDNRNDSKDSRDWGLLRHEQIVGLVLKTVDASTISDVHRPTNRSVSLVSSLFPGIPLPAQ